MTGSRTRTRVLAALATSVLCVTMAAAVSAQPQSQTVRMAVVKATVLAPALLVQKHLPPGWKTEITYFTSPGDMTNALLSDSVDLAYIGVTIGVVARSKDQPIVVVANQAGKGTAVVVRADSTIRSIQDLKGKKVGNLPTSIHDILLREELRKANLRPEDLQLIRLGPADMPSALQRGDIEAFSGNEPNSTIAVSSGYGRVLMFPYDNPVGSINVGVLSSDRHVRQKTALLRAWGTAHARATEELAANPDQWADLVSKEWGYDRAATRKSMDNIELKWQMDERFMTQFAAFSDRLKGLGVIQSVPDLQKLIVRDFLPAAR